MAAEVRVLPDRRHVEARVVRDAHKAVGEELLLEGAELVVLEETRQAVVGETLRVHDAQRRAVAAPRGVPVCDGGGWGGCESGERGFWVDGWLWGGCTWCGFVVNRL